MMRPSWHDYFMALAKIISTRSTCSSRPAGAVIVRDNQILATGYNGSVPGAPHCSGEQTDSGAPFCFRRSMSVPELDKYNYCRASHAEANAVAQAARLGIGLEGSTLYVTLAPCYVCLKLIATAHIKHIYFEYSYKSTDQKRDAFWENAMRQCQIETSQELHISEKVKNMIVNSLDYPTSQRRLTENDGKIISTGGPQPELINSRQPNSLEFKRILLDILRGDIADDKLCGNKVKIDIRTQLDDSFSNYDHQQATTFLQAIDLGPPKAPFVQLIMDDVIKELKKADLGQDVRVGNENAQIISTMYNGSLDITLELKSLDVMSNFVAACQTVEHISKELILLSMDRIDIGAEAGSLKLIVDKPYIEKSLEKEAEGIILGKS